MLKRTVTILLVLLFGALWGSAQEAGIFMLQGDGTTPAISHTVEPSDVWGREFLEQYTDPGAVTFHDGQFHMFRNGFKGWPARVWIHYMVSDDGVNWEAVQDNPVIVTEDVPYAEVAALASSVRVEDDGTWVLYFYTWNTRAGRSGESTIGRATADSPSGPWEVDPEPLLAGGEEGSWDEHGVAAPSVVKTDDGYLMTYYGIDVDDVMRIGVATSLDGITWEKSEANPVLTATEEWEGSILNQPRVIVTGSGYLMIYRTMKSDISSIRLALATSEDGITWQKSAANPLVAPSDFESIRAIWFTSLTQVDGTAYLFVELMPRLGNVTDIYTLTASIDDLLALQ